MTETTREQLAEMLMNNAERQNIAVPLNDAIHKLNHLAKLEDGIRALAKECEIRGENGKEAQFKDDPTAEESVRRAANKRLAGKLRALLHD